MLSSKWYPKNVEWTKYLKEKDKKFNGSNNKTAKMSTFGDMGKEINFFLNKENRGSGWIDVIVVEYLYIFKELNNSNQIKIQKNRFGKFNLELWRHA